jgi:hypothetical protein
MGVDVSSLSVCDPAIQNGDVVYVNNQADTGYNGYVTIIHVNQMQADASSAGECSANISQWIANHPFANGLFWTMEGSAPSSSSTSSSSSTPSSSTPTSSTPSSSTLSSLSQAFSSIKKYWEWVVIAVLVLILIGYFVMPKKK